MKLYNIVYSRLIIMKTYSFIHRWCYLQSYSHFFFFFFVCLHDISSLLDIDY